MLRDFVAGGAADAVSLLFVPMSVVCNRQITAEHGMQKDVPYRSAWGTLKDVYYGGGSSSIGQHSSMSMTSPTPRRRGDVRRLFAGFGAQVLFLPAGAMWWAVYGETKRQFYAVARAVFDDDHRDVALIAANTRPALQQQQQQASAASSGRRLLPSSLSSTRDNALINAAAGVVASGVTAVTFNPLAILRTRVQTMSDEGGLLRHGGGNSASSASNAPPSNSRSRYVRVAADLLKHEGWRGFFKGAPLNAAIAAGEGMMFAVLFEVGKFYGDVTTTAASTNDDVVR